MAIALPRPVRTDRAAPLATDLVAAIVVAGLCVVGLWIRHGGLTALTGPWATSWTSVTDLTGLLASYAGLVGLLLVARPVALERSVGLDRLFVWHRYAGETAAILVGAHVVAALVAASDPGGVWGAVRDLTGREPYMAAATVGALFIGVVTVTSLRSLRRRLAYETWYFVHLLAYAGLALAFAHQLALGGDLADDRLARGFWVGLHVAVVAALVWGRWGTTLRSALHPWRVRAVVPVGGGISTLHLSGGPEPMAAQPGQFFLLRVLRPGLWWHTHPYSLSAAPTAGELRFSVKDRGDASQHLGRLPAGTRVAVEGPYGSCTPALADGRRVLFVVGGVGVAPARAMIERLDRSHCPVVLYRARSLAEATHLDELQALLAPRGGRVLTLLGPTAALAHHDPFGAASVRGAVPDVAERVAIVCGPESLVHAARSGLLASGVAPSEIHFERAWW